MSDFDKDLEDAAIWGTNQMCEWPNKKEYQDGFTEGGRWAYDWMTKEHHQFALYRKVQDTKMEQEKRIRLLEQRLRFCAGYISGFPPFANKHPIEVMEWIEKEVDDMNASLGTENWGYER